MYNITNYSRLKASELGVIIKPSSKAGKKIDVYKNDKLICSIGDQKYLDYPNYISRYGLDVANKRRKLYKIRHKKDLAVIGSAGYYANKLLW